MTEERRKRRYSSIRETYDDSSNKRSKLDVSVLDDSEGRFQQASRHLKAFFSWLVDLPCKNYFIESTMAALYRRSDSLRKENNSLSTQSDDLQVEDKKNTLKRESNKGVKTISYDDLKCKNYVEQPLVRGRLRESQSEVSYFETAASRENGSSLLRSNVVLRNSDQSSRRAKASITTTSSVSKRCVRKVAAAKIVSTPNEILQLKERDQFKLLLEHFTVVPTQKLVVKDAESQTNSAFSKKKVGKHELSDFLSKYFKTSKLRTVTNSSASGGLSTSSLHAPSHSQERETENEVVITDIKVPSRSMSTLRTKHHFFDDAWIEELKKAVSEDVEKQALGVREQVKQVEEFRKKRAERIAKEEALNRNKYKLSGTVLPETVELESTDDSSEFPELSAEMVAKIEEALNPEPPEDVLCEGFNTQVTRRDIETLAGLNWLNDEIIYFYIHLLMERSKQENYPSVYAFNTFFYPKLLSGGHAILKRWTKKIDVFSYDLILVPVHMGMHWCLAVIDLRHRKIQYYDSMGGQNVECLNALRDYLMDECLDKKKVEFDMSRWSYENVKNIPQQMNGSDCGMFALKYAEYITRDAKISFTQENMQYFRRRMVYEILTKQLL